MNKKLKFNFFIFVSLLMLSISPAHATGAGKGGNGPSTHELGGSKGGGGNLTFPPNSNSQFSQSQGSFRTPLEYSPAGGTGVGKGNSGN